MNTTVIKGSHINLDSLKDLKNQKALKSTEIFSHLSEEDQADAYGELWGVLKPSNKVAPPLDNSTAAIAASDGDNATQE